MSLIQLIISFLTFLSSLNVSMANFVDILIDYPNSKIYVEQLFERLQQESILTDRQVANYRLHIENVEKQGIDIDID